MSLATKMSRPELHKTDSTGSGPPDSDSLLSEPPDIGNWFSSYVYESPELNTLDGLQDFHGPRETCLEEGKKGKSGEIPVAVESIDGSVSAGRKLLGKAIDCGKSDELEHVKLAATVAGSSESLSFSSEPPDIKNWFSSYFYESSPLDTTRDFTVSEYRVKEDCELYNAQKNHKNENCGVMDFDVKGSIELPNQSRTSCVVVKCTNLVEDSKVDYKPLGTADVHNGSLTPMSSRSTHRNISQQILPEKRTANCDLGSSQKFGDTNTNGEDNDMKLDSSLFERTAPKENNYIPKLAGSKDCTKDSLEEEDIKEIASPGILGSPVSKEDSSRNRANMRSTGKENKKTELFENGFVSVRKGSKENAGNLTKPARFQFESSGHEVKPVMRCQKNANTCRKVLSETTNFLSPVVVESTGKWCCPQKNKPDNGPPRKQLRLEQWVHRV
ncbi:SPX (SYG1/Pho81/XPR1) domain-containing protein /zinc finger (C3HC4-type RING finger) protein-related [Striga asiatica]|uniref:SPX (SYG1/Pho81/XPR1) domain-containing protein /zinc finger (C3HC4-type RING finger) protein-related n=1 Tax=Striga asiatica TaxID=4170 RepID=A0A5A7NZ11_STRAF|nr:SPX (SYG1/Pho81/XPR1) domain-containing protein /zinc finger (C3HC4-type RING finger) protein-related [Striga asiatica]